MSVQLSNDSPVAVGVSSGAGLERQQMSALAAELLLRRREILAAWRTAAETDQKIGASLSGMQFNDHIPAVLDCYAHTIQAWRGETNPLGEDAEEGAVCDHGLQRWQQGYQLTEVIREWGHLQLCVAEELERYAALHPSIEKSVMRTARRVWTQMCADGVTESASQYWRLHQTESAGHVNDLEQALAALHDLERARAEGWRVAAHDLRGSVTVVKGATNLLEGTGPELPEPVRAEATEILGKSVASLNEMLNDLLSLARVEAGRETREVSSFDAAALLRDFCIASQSAAKERGLFLKMSGPAELPVQGDRAKILRIVQNLLLNAMKYTELGGVSVTWGADTSRDTDRWTFSVQDTGPGIDENSAAPFAQELLNATQVAHDAREASTDRRRGIAPPTTLPSVSPALPQSKQPGEGVGLTIVKRLCELLDAGLELVTEPGRGTTFRVILPRSYDSGRNEEGIEKA